MNCRQARRKLSDSKCDSSQAAAEAHLRSCFPCQSFADRLREAQQLLGARRNDVLPDPSFAARVLSQLPSREPTATSELLGWAALRLLPMTLALLLALSLWSLSSSPSPTVLLAEESSRAELSWLLDVETGTTEETSP
ncbi:MAG: hypothetical protein K0U98_16550 [Deltaproteobacteria bacterium]|nr:hypothetical protein [Deltaproteobacteria bacterium]